MKLIYFLHATKYHSSFDFFSDSLITEKPFLARRPYKGRGWPGWSPWAVVGRPLLQAVEGIQIARGTQVFICRILGDDADGDDLD